MNIKPYEKNAKEHPKKQVELIAKSIKRFGWQQPIKVGKDNVIIVGHGRYLAFQEYGEKLGLKEPWVIDEAGKTLSGSPETTPLSIAEEKAYRMADNQINAISGNDMTLIVDELKLLEDDLIEITGFDKDLILETEEKDDEVPGTPEEPQSKLGDLYELGNHRVLCGDSTKIEDVERLMDGKKADMVFTDPPYGVDYDGGHAEKGKRRDKLENDDETDMYAGSIPLAYSYSVDSAPLYLWFADRFAKDVLNALEDNDYQVRTWIIWNKNMAQFGAIGAQYKTKHEPVIYAFKKGKAPTWNGPTNEVTVWDVDRHSKNEFHPTQKPTALSERAILNHIGTEGIVLDLFLGSGATLIGANKTGRICYGMEIDPKYVDVIVQRYCEFTGNKNIKKNGIDIVWE